MYDYIKILCEFEKKNKVKVYELLVLFKFLNSPIKTSTLFYAKQLFTILVF